MGWLADETGLEKTAANYVPLTPLSHLKRAADIHANRIALVWKTTRLTYADYALRATRLASGLARRGVQPGDVVATLLPNIPQQAEAHFGVPACGAVLNTINTRLDADTVGYIFGHAGAKVVLVFCSIASTAVSYCGHLSRFRQSSSVIFHCFSGTICRSRKRSSWVSGSICSQNLRITAPQSASWASNSLISL